MPSGSFETAGKEEEMAKGKPEPEHKRTKPNKAKCKRRHGYKWLERLNAQRANDKFPPLHMARLSTS